VEQITLLPFQGSSGGGGGEQLGTGLLCRETVQILVGGGGGSKEHLRPRTRLPRGIRSTLGHIRTRGSKGGVGHYPQLTGPMVFRPTVQILVCGHA
jgi:hypothetical protein